MKNILLFTAFLLTTASSYAQLTVKPTAASTDSYVYVKDQILYVKGDIHLEMNTLGGNIEASIYLRDQGQLIQGGTSSSNSGNGFLSVRQTAPQTNAFAYRYWSSPVSQSIGIGNQNFGVALLYDHLAFTNLTRALQTTTTGDLNGLRGTPTAPMTISTRWLYTHMIPGTEAEGNYQRMRSGYNAPAGYGFTMKGVGITVNGQTGGDQTYEFRGRPNNGDFTIQVGHNGTDPLMTLSGNPYPSALDLNKLFYEPGNEHLGAFWYYDEDRSVASHHYSGKPFGYGTYTVGPVNHGTTDNGTYVRAPFFFWNSGGTRVSDTLGFGAVRTGHRFAPIGQGIMFVGESGAGASADVTIKNSHRVFIKENPATSILNKTIGGNNYSLSTQTSGTINNNNSLTTGPAVDNRLPQMRLYIVFDDAVTRDLVLSFSDKATDGYDRGLDGHSPRGLNTDAYFPIGTKTSFDPYVIQAVKFQKSKKVPINFSLNKQTKINVRLVEEIKKPYEKVYLYDSQENTYKWMKRASDDASSTFYLPAGEHNHRFFIVFENTNDRIGQFESIATAREEILKNVIFFQNNPSRQLEIKNPNGYDVRFAAMYDMNGKMVVKELQPGKENQFNFYTGNLSDGVYLVKLITNDNINIDHKIIVDNN